MLVPKLPGDDVTKGTVGRLRLLSIRQRSTFTTDIFERQESVNAQTLIPEASVEGLGEWAVRWYARP